MQSEVWKTVSLPAPEMLLLLSVSDLAHDDGGGIFASDEYLSWKTGIPIRTIQAIKKKWRDSRVLVPVGFYHLDSRQSVLTDVSVVRGMGGRGWTVLYRLSLEPFAKKEPWRQGRTKKVAISATFNNGQKVAIAAGEGRNGAQQKVATDAPEGRNGAQRNKEELSVELSGNLSGEQGPLPFSTSGQSKAAERRPATESVLTIRQRDFLKPLPDKWEFGLANFSREPNPRQGLFEHVRACSKRAGIPTYTEAQLLLKDHPGWKSWPDLELLSSQQEIAFPEPSKPAQSNGHGRINYPADYESGGPVWVKMLNELQKLITRHSFDTWLKPTRQDGVWQGILFVRVPTPEFRHIGEKFGEQLKALMPEGINKLRFATIEDMLAEFGEVA